MHIQPAVTLFLYPGLSDEPGDAGAAFRRLAVVTNVQMHWLLC
jgi:hypothetical protein